MKIAVCPGSFDPVTNGHLDILRRAAELFDRVIAVVATNFDKHCVFTEAERVELLRRCTGDIPNLVIDAYGGLLAEYARTKGADVIVKGLRAMSDFENEFQMALTNRKLNPGVETIFLATSAENMYLSSSLVKQVAALGGDFSAFVPASIHDIIMKKFERTDNL